MARLPAMPAYTDAYLADTMDLTTEEHGAYWLMLLAAWRAPDCSLPDDDVRLARTTRMSKHRWQRRMRPVMERFWDIASGQWTQKKQLRIRKQVEQNVEQKSAAGKASALKKKETTSTAVSQPYQQPKPKKKEKKDTSNEVCKDKKESPPPNPLEIPPQFRQPPTRNAYTPELEEFWMSYPKRTNTSKKDAFKVWKRLLQAGPPPEEIIHGARCYAAYCEAAGTPGPFLTHAATWLNGERHREYAGETTASVIEKARMESRSTGERPRPDSIVVHEAGERFAARGGLPGPNE